jgi:biopolymer transport protein ExbD
MSFRQDQRVQIDGDFVGLAALAERARQAVRDRPEKTIMLALDGDITSTEMIRVWDRLREGGVEQVNLQTQPTTGRR